MNRGPSSLRRLFGRHRPESLPVEDDPADMGTCFGIEMRLAAADPCPPDQAPASISPEAWWERLGSRGPLPA